MSALVGYASSDEEDDIQPEKPSKIAKVGDDEGALQRTSAIVGAQTETAPQDIDEPAAPPYAPVAEPETSNELLGPAPGPFAPSAAAKEASTTPSDPPLSPYTSERLRIRELTMPPVPNFDIPDAPPPPPVNSEEAAALAATTKRFERFLELKKQGVHFNERLQGSTSLRNPSLLPKLMDFAGISREDNYASTLPEDMGGVPVKWPEECYVESLVKLNERKEKKRLAEREKVAFVPAAKSTASSAAAQDGREFKVHNFIVAPASPIFKTMIADTNEQSELALRESGFVLDNVLRFIYSQKFNDLTPTAPDAVDEDLAAFLGTCDAAEKYQIPGLSDYTSKQVMQATPRIPEGRLTTATVLCGDDVRGNIARHLLQSVTKDEPANAPPVPQAPSVVGESICVEKRKPKSKPTVKVKSERPVTRPTKAETHYCVCNTHSKDKTLVQCDGCDQWFHPGCIGKGRCRAKTYAGDGRKGAQRRDVTYYRDKAFRCAACAPIS